MPAVTIVGPGRVGGALALALSANGYTIDSIIYRSRKSAAALERKLKSKPELSTLDEIDAIRSPILFITTGDSEISRVTRKLAKRVSAGTVVFHTSGSLASDVLAPFRQVGASVASFHPLASISSADLGIERFQGASFCLEGDEKAVRIGRRMVRLFGGRSFRIEPSAKVLYHTAAVTAAGHVTALFDVAVSLMERAGLTEKQAQNVLQPLLAGTAANLAVQDTASALTGTIARGDPDALSRHIEALRSSATARETAIFLELALRSLDLAEKRGVDAANIRKMRRAISVAKRDIEC
jgi:predicted short-subunit dehydrogenase-like oxidoreductase (DUF2520 family)